MLERKFQRLGADYAPGQEVRQSVDDIDLKGKKLSGNLVDFSHGDVDAFEPIPGSLDTFIEGVNIGGKQAYTEYRGSKEIREKMLNDLSNFIDSDIGDADNLIITPGTQGALFLAIGSTVTRGTKVAIVEPDYFANRKLVEFFEGEAIRIDMDFLNTENSSGIDLTMLEDAFKSGVKLFLFSNPNNPTGVIYSKEEINSIANLAKQYNATVIVDELYSRQVFDDREFTHLAAQKIVDQDNLLTIMGPSKTESLSGYRLGIAYGSTKIIERMEKLQAIVSLRASGYNQAVLKTWFSEPTNWLEKRLQQHQAIRDDIVERFQNANGFTLRSTEAGSYLFPKIADLSIPITEFVKILRAQASVIVTPGTEFGRDFGSSFRINFSQDHEEAVAAVDRIIKVSEEYRK